MRVIVAVMEGFILVSLIIVSTIIGITLALCFWGIVEWFYHTKL